MLDKDVFVDVSKEELEDIALESTRTIEIDESSTARRRSGPSPRLPMLRVWLGPFWCA